MKVCSNFSSSTFPFDRFLTAAFAILTLHVLLLYDSLNPTKFELDGPAGEYATTPHVFIGVIIGTELAGFLRAWLT